MATQALNDENRCPNSPDSIDSFDKAFVLRSPDDKVQGKKKYSSFVAVVVCLFSLYSSPSKLSFCS